jgi:GxxExxY protein
LADENLERLSKRVIGAAIEVHRDLGPGFLESVYEESLAVEFGLRHIPFSRQHIIHVQYKNHLIGESRLDFLVGGQLIVELKAIEQLMPIHTAQVISYLKATNHELALLINFNVRVLMQGLKRIILTSVRDKDFMFTSPRCASLSSPSPLNGEGVGGEVFERCKAYPELRLSYPDSSCPSCSSWFNYFSSGSKSSESELMQ